VFAEGIAKTVTPALRAENRDEAAAALLAEVAQIKEGLSERCLAAGASPSSTGMTNVPRMSRFPAPTVQ